MDIKKITSSLSFESLEEDMFAEVFAEAAIEKAFNFEETLPNAVKKLPKDYLWYLENYGCRTVKNLGYLVSLNADTAYIVLFMGLNDPTKVAHNYRYQTCTGSYAYRKNETGYQLPPNFLPIFSESNDKMLVMDFMDEVGSILITHLMMSMDLPLSSERASGRLKSKSYQSRDAIDSFFVQINFTAYFIKVTAPR